MKLMLKASIATLVLILAGTTVATYAQRCGGDMTYFLRNTKGEMIDSEKIELKHVRAGSATFYPQESITEYADHFRGPGHLVPYPVDETGVKPEKPSDWVKVLRVQTGCGQPFIEAELEHEHQVMVIRFHNIPAEIDFFVDSVLFQEGTFEIDFKKDMALKDQKVNREGLKSKTGKIFLRGVAQMGFLVSAENWLNTTALRDDYF